MRHLIPALKGGCAGRGPRARPLSAEEWSALGTSARVVVTGDGDVTAARAAVAALLEAVDLACSRFRDDSELSALNRAGGRWAAIGPTLQEALEAALWAAAATGGAVDPTVGRALRTAGYDRDFAALPTDGEPLVVPLTPAPGWQAVELDRARRLARLAPGAEVDLGSTAKALAADRAARAGLAASQASGCLVALGGDIAVAGAPPEGGWPILVTEDCSTPLDAEGEVVAIEQGGVATSSTRVRRWTKGQIEMHHIIDPATGAPVNGPWRSATVAAQTCLQANTAATAAIVMGTDAAAWLNAHGLPARLVSGDGAIAAIAGWPG